MRLLHAVTFGSGMMYGYGTITNNQIPLSTVVPFVGTITVWKSFNLQVLLRQQPPFMFTRPLYPISLGIAIVDTMVIFGLGNLFIKMAKPVLKNSY